MILDARGLVVQYPGAAAPALNGVDLAMHPGELVAVVGPNGSGKTSLLRAVLGLVPLAAGQVSVAGRPLGEWGRADLAQTVALVPQREDTPFSWTVDEMVGFGRYARLGALSSFSRDDREAIDRALARCDVTGLRGCFALWQIADPTNVIAEGDETNNAARTVVELRGSRKPRIGRC